MIEIRNLEGLLADLYADTSISIEKNNPLFNDKDDFFEDITYSFKMPATDNNKLFFSSGHLIEANNDVYKMPVQCIVSGFPFFAGSIKYNFVDGDFDAILLVNFGEVVDKIKNIKISEIYFDDINPNEVTTAYMKTVCQNPGLYPYAYFPVYNEKWWSGGVTTYPIINNWDHATQNFILSSGFGTAVVPYFKLKYILTKIMNYLGFECAGGYMADAENEKIYIYNPIYFARPNNSNTYLPYDLLITDFLKQIRERCKISCSFDVFNGVANIESANSLLNSTAYFDLSPYISDVAEINTAPINGYSLTLKPNPKDAAFKDPGDATKYLPTNKLIIGKGEKELELAISTLKAKAVADYVMPMTSEQLYGKENFPLRLLYYNGMRSVAGSKIFPEAKPLELSLNDAVWYQFLNDGKILKINACVPSYLLTQLTASKKIGIRSTEGYHSTAIAEKISYSLGNSDSEYVNVSIDCRTVVFNYTTPVSIVPFAKTAAESSVYNNNLYKAFFADTGLAEVEIKAYYPAGSSGFEDYLPLAADRIDTIIIKQSTDKYRGGGLGVYMPFVNLDTVSRKEQEIRIYTGIPKYLIVGGYKVLFTLHGSGYYWCKPFASYGTTNIQIDYQPIWIVF